MTDIYTLAYKYLQMRLLLCCPRKARRLHTAPHCPVPRCPGMLGYICEQNWTQTLFLELDNLLMEAGIHFKLLQLLLFV